LIIPNWTVIKAMFNQLLGVFQGFFSRNYWLGNFLPVLISSMLHLVAAKSIFPNLPALDTFLGTQSYVAALTATFAVLVTVAYALSPLTTLIRGLLDGSLLPMWLHNALQKEHVISSRKARKRIAEAQICYREYRELNTSDRLKLARKQGQNNPSASNPLLVRAAADAIDSVRDLVDRGMIPDIACSKNAFDKLEKALSENSAITNTVLSEHHRKLIGLLNDAEKYSIHEIEYLKTYYRTVLVIDTPRATRMGDARAVKERYCEVAFQVDFNFLWPRLQLQFTDKSSAVERMMAARAQSDFALLSLALVVVFAMIWLPILSWNASTPWVLLGTGILAPIAISFFYRIGVEAELAFSDEVIALIDFHRFDVIKNVLRLPLPQSLFAERDLWSNNILARTHGVVVNLTYRHTE
jgi:hypothetical protein